ncbi:hypothetical protein [Shewanella frigidimarina]|uniref:hypothetical protein n=1 Tax=Shewanella frigidimarina TaxID=56812 RepID=UPI000F4D7A6B|nr:hypothetical protein [Shewanella frigidimarina]RPA38334.1 hypothetical protein EGC78_00690 [Shewanella frigidimarina]
MTKVYVLCPGNVVTGGPELLHQLVDSLNKKGDVASIVYYPFESTFDVPNAYKHYKVNHKAFSDVNFEGHAVVLPEILTGYKRFFPKSKVYIWWMSVDNYFKHFPTGLRRLKNKLTNYNKSPIRVHKLTDCSHLAQSEYAREFLANYGLTTYMLSDYLNQEHLDREVDLSKKQNIISYNPLKGIEVTQKIRDFYKGYQFVPIQNMTAKEVAELLEKSKVYIDFGDHPGKDRIPREAAMAKCIVITGRKGSANNLIDIAVPDKYKIDEDSKSFIVAIGEAFSFAFDDFENALHDYELYRTKIQNEKRVFDEEVNEFFESIK